MLSLYGKLHIHHSSSQRYVLTLYRLSEETAKVEEHLLDGSFSKAIIDCFTSSKADAFENLLEPLQKLLRLSPPVAATLAHPELFSRTVKKLDNKKAVVRGNLLRIIKSICEAVDDQGALLRKYGLYDAIERLSEGDPAVLVRNMAVDLIKASEANNNMRGSGDSNRFRPLRRTSSSAISTSSLYASSPQPMSPLQVRGHGQSAYFDNLMEYNVGRPRSARNPAVMPPRRPSIDSVGTNDTFTGPRAPDGAPQIGLGIKSRLPRTSMARRPTAARREENDRPPPTPPAAQSAMGALPRASQVNNPRRRRPTDHD